jgi:hypothetical protein
MRRESPNHHMAASKAAGSTRFTAKIRRPLQESILEAMEPHFTVSDHDIGTHSISPSARFSGDHVFRE